MPYEDDYKMWLEKSLIEMNPDWVCDGMTDKEFTHKWCEENCGKDNAYIMPKCLHMYYHHIARTDRKTENSSEKPNNCTNCECTDDCTECREAEHGCKDEPQPCEWCKFYDGENCFSQEPCKAMLYLKTEPTISKMEQVDKDINVRSKDEPQTCSFSDCDNFKNPDYERCIECKRKQIKLKTEQTERSK